MSLRSKLRVLFRDLRECLKKAIRDRDCHRELLDAIVEDYDEMGRAYKAELTTLRVELKKRSLAPSSMEAECM